MNTPTVDYPIEEWERVLRINLTSQFLCCRAVAPLMVKGGYGRIVNIASIAGKEGNLNAVAYSASKAGVIALTKSLGKELARTGVLVNCVTPAAAKTMIFEQMTQQHIDYMLSKIPMNRFVTVDEVAALVCWLASETAVFYRRRFRHLRRESNLLRKPNQGLSSGSGGRTSTASSTAAG